MEKIVKTIEMTKIEIKSYHNKICLITVQKLKAYSIYIKINKKISMLDSIPREKA